MSSSPSLRGGGGKVSAFCACGHGLAGVGVAERLGWRFGGVAWRSWRARRTWGARPSESCLTISSEERETWTAVSLRGFGSHRNPKRLADGHVSNDHFFSGRFVTNV